MREVELWLRATRETVMRKLGEDSRNVRSFGGQVRLSGMDAGILSLPDMPSSAIDMIIVDPGSPYFGERRFVAGVSRLDGTDRIG